MSEHKEPIPSMIYNASVGGHVTSSQQIIDENENKEQSQINSEVKKTLGQGGSVDARISQAKNDIIGGASSNGNTLKKIEDRVSPLESTVGAGGSVDSRIAAAKSELKGDATSACDTLGKAETLISDENTRAQGAESTLQNNISAETTRATTAEENLRTIYNNLQQSQPIPVTSLPATGEAGNIYRLAGTNSYADYMYAEGALTTPIKMAEYGVSAVYDYAKKSFLSNNGKFNSIFKEFYIANANFDVAQVTSMYIDKAMYRSTGGVYRDQIVLKIGNSEVAQFKIDSNASDKALAIYRNREVNYGADINGAMLFFILDWSSLESNQRHTFDVSLTSAVTKIECNPTIYSILKTNKKKYLVENAAWTAFSIDEYGAYTDTEYIRSCSGNIYIPDNSKTVSVSGIASGYKYEVAIYNNSNELIKYYYGWKTDTQEFILPDFSYYIRILMARADNTVLLPYDLINGNPNLTIEFAANEIGYSLHSLTIGNMNVRGFADTIESTQKSDNPNVYLPLWKEVMTWLNQDFLTIVEWWDEYDKAGNINAYDALLKQFYPYHYTIDGQRGLFSKIPCSFETKTRNYNQIVAKTTINGKSLAVVVWVQANTDDESKVRADSQWMIDYLQDFDMVVVSGDFNNEQGPQFLQVWLDNGYTLGNCGYWGEIDTCITSAFTHSSNDNIVVKGFGSYDNFEKGEEKVGSDHYPVRAKLGYVI